MVGNCSRRLHARRGVSELCRLRLGGRWWIKLVDASSRRAAVAHGRDGVVDVQRTAVPEPMSNGHVYPLPMISICLDRNSIDLRCGMLAMHCVDAAATDARRKWLNRELHNADGRFVQRAFDFGRRWSSQ